MACSDRCVILSAAKNLRPQPTHNRGRSFVEFTLECFLSRAQDDNLASIFPTNNYRKVPLSKWKKVRREFELRNPWWSYRKDIVQLPNGKRGEYHSVHVKGSSMVIPVRGDGKIIMVSQYRYLADKDSLEFPCGSVKKLSTYLKTAREELAEETGFAAKSLTLVGEFNPYNGVTDEMCRVYLARNLYPVKSHHDETEEFEQFALSPKQIEKKIASGELWDGMSLAAWAIVR